jgi:DNA-binding GntR family transcriptional regulator
VGRSAKLARAAVERAAAAVVAEQRPTAALDALQEIVEAIAASVDGSWTDLIVQDLSFHQSLVDAAGSLRLSRMFSTLSAETRLCLARLEPFYEGATEVAAEHQAILDALRAGDAKAVDRLIQGHMDAAAARLCAD